MTKSTKFSTRSVLNSKFSTLYLSNIVLLLLPMAGGWAPTHLQKALVQHPSYGETHPPRKLCNNPSPGGPTHLKKCTTKAP